MDFLDVSQEFAKAATTRNKAIFENIFWKKKNCLERVLGIQKALEHVPSIFLDNLEQELISEYDKILKQEELFWF